MSKRIRYFGTLFGMAWLPAWCLSALAAPQLSVVGYELAGQRRLSATVFEYTYKIQVRNAGTAAQDVEIDLRSTPPGVFAVSRGAAIARIEGGSIGVSGPDIVIRHDRTKPFRFDALTWSFISHDGTFTGLLAGLPATPAVSASSNYWHRVAEPVYVDNGSGSLVDLKQLSLEISEGATVAQVNAAVGAVGGLINGMSVGSRRFDVAMPSNAALADLDRAFTTVSRMPGVASAWPSVSTRAFTLPPNLGFADATVASFLQTVPPLPAPRSAYIQNHLAVRASAAWNLKGLIDKPELSISRPTLLIWDSFTNQLPGGAFGADVRDLDITGVGYRLDPDNPPVHGYAVLGIAQGSYGGDESPAGLIAGLYPSPLHTRVVKTNDLNIGLQIRRVIEIIEEAVTGVLQRNLILNTSFGGCNASAGPPCSEERRLLSAYWAAAFLQQVQAQLLDGAGQPLFLHAYAVGNNPNAWAYMDRFGAADALVAIDNPLNDPLVPLLHPPGGLAKLGLKPGSVIVNSRVRAADVEVEKNAAGLPIVLPKLTNMLGVESKTVFPTQFVAFPGDSARGIPPSARWIPPVAKCHAGTSTKYGTLAGVGGGSVLDGDPLNWIIAGPGTDVDTGGGTSLASPQVAAAAAWVWSLVPDLKATEVSRLLRGTTIRSQDQTCQDSPAYSDLIDVYAAALSTDNPYPVDDPRYKNLGATIDAPARKFLLDVAGYDGNGNLISGADGQFTQADILWFLRQFEKRKGDQTPDYSRYDLNGNAVTGEPASRQDARDYSRFDLNGDLAWTYADKTVEGVAQSFREDITTDLEVLVYYAYSPLYAGNEYERTLLLLPYLRWMPAPASLFLNELQITVPPTQVRSATLLLGNAEAVGETFTSACTAERGTPLFSAEVEAQRVSRAADAKAYFWRPTSYADRFQEKPANAQNCSSFFAALPAHGLLWVNSVVRNLNATTGADEEYQTRFFLGEPDLAAAPASDGVFRPTARRLATQKLTYGIVPSPAAAFRPLFSATKYTLDRLKFLPGTP